MKHSTPIKKIFKKTKQVIPVLVLFASCFYSTLSAQSYTVYGMAQAGGTKDSGVIFKCTRTGTYSTINNALGTATGAIPFQCGLVLATDGNFYGMTGQGGAVTNDGTIFRCTPAGLITVLYSFTGPEGKSPRGSLIQANDGNLYGVTYNGGKYNDGVVFKCTLAGVYDTLASFFANTTGQFPRGSLLQATDGNLYGMTQTGGGSGDGVLFKCTLAGVLTPFVTFTGAANGASTFYGTIMQAADGNLYGTTSNGGSNTDGTLFKCTLAGVLTKLVDFTGAGNGSGIVGNLVQASNTNIYGVTSGGGAAGDGTIFQYTLAGVLTTLDTFKGANGASPQGGLTLGSDGNLYGVTSAGGTNNIGTLFSCTPSGMLSTLYSFAAGNNGNSPSGNLVVVTSTGVDNISNSTLPNIYPNPSNGHYTMTGLNKRMMVEVYDYTGRKLSSISANDITMQLNLTGYSNGVYLIRVLSNDGNLVGEQKIVKL